MIRWKHAILPHQICLLNLQSNFPTVTPCSQAAHILPEYFSHCILYLPGFFFHIKFCSVQSVNIESPENIITPFFPLLHHFSSLHYPHILKEQPLLFLIKLNEYSDLFTTEQAPKKSAASSYLRMSNLSGKTWVYYSLAPFSCWCLLNRYNLMKNIKYLKSIYH